MAPALLDRDLLVVTGKGGVGKTMVATALGLAAARRGRRTIIVEVARRDDVARALGTAPHPEVALAPGLHHMSVDPEAVMEEYLLDQLPSRTAAELLLRSRAFTYLAAATPGLRELLTAGKVWELAQPQRRRPGDEPYDLVVVDAPATGHAVALLQAPRAIADAALVGRIARQARTIDAMLSDRARTGVIAVARPQELAVTEALELQDLLPARTGLELELVVANALPPRPLARAAAGSLAALPPSPPVAAALVADGRARDAHAQLGRLRRDARCPVLPLRRRLDPDPAAASAELERSL